MISGALPTITVGMMLVRNSSASAGNMSCFILTLDPHKHLGMTLSCSHRQSITDPLDICGQDRHDKWSFNKLLSDDGRIIPNSLQAQVLSIIANCPADLSRIESTLQTFSRKSGAVKRAAYAECFRLCLQRDARIAQKEASRNGRGSSWKPFAQKIRQLCGTSNARQIIPLRAAGLSLLLFPFFFYHIS